MGLKKFLDEFRIGKNTSDALPTHLSLRGGKYVIPEDKRADLFACLASHSNTNQRHYLLEVKGTVFNYFLDVDAKKYAHTLEEYKALLSTLKDILLRCLPSYSADNEIFDMILLKSEADFSAHVILRNLKVTRKEAMLLTNQLKVALKEMKTDVPWDKVLDTKPYGKLSSLRMYGASKCTRCKHCKPTDKDCEVCEGTRFVHLGKRYYPYLGIFKGEFLRSFDAYTLEDLLTMCSIQARAEETVVDGFRFTSAKSAKRKRKMTQKAPETQRKRVKEDKTDSSLWKILQKLPVCLHPCYRDVPIRQVEFHDDVYKILVHCKKCLNLRKPGAKGGEIPEHTNNNVYFLVNKLGIQQRCFCDCPDKTCRNYSSMIKPIKFMLTNDEYMSLFPPSLDSVMLPIKLTSLSKDRHMEQVNALRRFRAYSKQKQSLV